MITTVMICQSLKILNRGYCSRHIESEKTIQVQSTTKIVVKYCDDEKKNDATCVCNIIRIILQF